ncbi:MAG: hypothetical protein E7467_04205 [Ruminococcaceae bacterium]|nr:hypothetical protein [Oscillospiraceae bacterium]
MRKIKSVLALVLALTIVLGCVGTAFAAKTPSDKDFAKTTKTEFASDKAAKEEAMAGFKSESFKELNTYRYADDEIVRAIVILDGKCEAEVAENGTEKAAAQRVKLINEHNTVRKAMKGIRYEFKHEFTTLLNGFSCDVAYGDLEAIAAIEGVKAVHIANSYAEPEYKIPTDTKMAIANEYMTGNADSFYDYYDGSGIVVAVLDTGLNTTHEAFQDSLNFCGEYGLLTEEYVNAALEFTNGEGKYINAKVPFAYDYAEGDNDVTDYNGHGTHVSGSVAGYVGETTEDGGIAFSFMGGSPYAQLLSMKIFMDEEGGTTSDIYFDALEDAYILGADVINMSIGAQNGFTYDASLEDEYFGNIYETLRNAGVILSVAAGNEYSMSYYTTVWEGYTGIAGADYTDYGTVASPSTYTGNASVASVENLAYPAYVLTVGEANIPYTDSATEEKDSWLKNFGDKTLEFVIVRGADGKISLGAQEDYANYDVSGKIAVVSRGEYTFEEKVEWAAAAGAVGCIVVNNDEGIISMQIETFEIPAISLEMSALEILEAAEVKEITTSPELVYIDNANAALMSEFSNWGTSPMLTLTPSITSVGGNVYSTVIGSDDAYEVYSGTSMAAPNASATYANVLTMIYNENPDISKYDAAELARDLMESTAIILGDADGYPYSPRKQGAGLANSQNAIWNYLKSAYIVDPLVELGDDAEKTGIYEMSLTVKNDSKFEVYYTDFDVIGLYDYLYNVAKEGEDPNFLNTLTSDYLDIETTFSSNGAEISEFTLAPNEEISIDVSIALTEKQKAELDANFDNGTFIEGFVTFTEYYEGQEFADIHATFLAYYGDWTKGPVLEGADFIDIVEAEYWLNTTVANADGDTYGDLGYTYANSGLLSFITEPKTARMVDAGITKAYGYLGDNMLGYAPYYPEHMAFSTSATDGTYNYAEALFIEPYQLRNARHLIMTVSNKETGEVYYVDDTEYLPKSYFDNDYAAWMSMGQFVWDGTDENGDFVPSGTVATITFDAVLPYGDTEVKDIWTMDVTVDYTAPVIEDVVYDVEAETVTVTATDENYLQAIYLADASYNIIDAALFSSDKKGETFTATFNVKDIDSAIVTAIDYASNENEEEAYFFETGLAAKINLVTPAGTEVIECKTGDTFVYEAAEAPADHEFMFWAPEIVEKATEDEIWNIAEPWFFEGDAMTVIETEYTFYALYARVTKIPLEKANFYMDYDVDYSGDWALCGWNTDSNYYFITEDPMALDAQGNTVRVADFEDAEMGTEYIEFYSNEKSILFTIEAVEEGVYTIKNSVSGKYLATDETLAIKFVDTADDNAKWYISDAETGYSSLVENKGIKNAYLLYNDETGKFQIFDNSIPYYGEYMPAEWFSAVLYRCVSEETAVDYYTSALPHVYVCPSVAFKDVNVNDWFHEAVDFMVKNDYMNGVAPDTFAPNATLTRGMVVTVLYRMAGSPAVEAPSTFTDVKEGEWYADAIAWAQANGVVKGMTETTFEPLTAVTREQIATILYRYAGGTAVEIDLGEFADADKISAWALEAMLWAVNEGIFSGDNGNLNPTHNATRAQFATIMYRYSK